MKIVLIAHPLFLNSKSMPRYANWLAEGMRARGHQVDVWRPEPFFFRLPVPASFKKWMGYIDQYLIFPRQVKNRLATIPQDTLYVFADQALGPWVPLVADKPHVVHCHDFLALRSALGKIPENKTRSTGIRYQKYIREGFSKGKYFISISKKTQDDLHGFLPHTPVVSEVVYNGVNELFKELDKNTARSYVSSKLSVDLSKGYILHVGGNQWYKNRLGVIEIYDGWRSSSKENLPLLLVGAPPLVSLLDRVEQSPYKKDIYFVTNFDDEGVLNAYNGASVFVFPSLAEGFGWPIVEAMACKCPVITTNEAPMTEVAGNTAYFIQRMPASTLEKANWASAAGNVVEEIVSLSLSEQEKVYNAGLQNAERFKSDDALDKIEAIYKEIILKA